MYTYLTNLWFNFAFKNVLVILLLILPFHRLHITWPAILNSFRMTFPSISSGMLTSHESILMSVTMVRRNTLVSFTSTPTGRKITMARQHSSRRILMTQKLLHKSNPNMDDLLSSMVSSFSSNLKKSGIFW